MQVLVFDQQSDLSISHQSVKPIVKEVLENEKRRADEVAVYFVSTEKICQLHQEFFDDPSPTDCISFPMDEQQTAGYQILGEIFICPKTALDYLLTLSEEVTHDPLTEVTLYLVHGLLHLLGYKDIEEEDVKKMRGAEQRQMEHLINEKLLLKGT